MKKFKRIICIILAALIIVTAPITTYMEAKATSGVVTAGVLDYLLGLFGVSVGMGNQSDFWTQSNMDYIYDGIANGNVVSMGSYGDVDFSNSDSVYSWINTMAAVDGFLVGASSGNLGLGEDVAKTIKSNCVKMDMISYHNTGTTATGAMNEYITELRDEFQTAPEQSLKELQEYIRMMYVIGSMASPNGDDDDEDDDEKAARKKKMWRNFCAITSASILGGTAAALPLSALKEASDSQYHEYDAAFSEDICFDGTYQMNADGEYVYKISSSDKIVIKNGYTAVQWAYDTTSSYKIAGYRYYNGSRDCINFVNYLGDAVFLSCLNNGAYSYISANGFVGNIPVYSTKEEAVAALNSGDFSDAENLNDAYRNFKNNTSSAVSSLGSLLGLMSRMDNLSKLADIVPGALSTADTNTGTPEALTSVNDYLSGVTPSPSPSPSPDPDPEPGTGTGKDYTGILGKILTAINNLLSALNNLPAKIVNLLVTKFMTADNLEKLMDSLPMKFVTAFASKFMTADNLELLINGLPDLFGVVMKSVLIQVFPDAITVGNAVIGMPDLIVRALPDAIRDILLDLFPDSEAVGKSLIGLPDVIVDALKGIVFSPIIQVPKPQVDVQLNPNYDITVQNDFTGLGDIVIAAVSAALSDLFIPDADATKAKLGDMREYFKFKDDIIGAFDDLKTMIFGITPSPILKIPIGAETSKYNYGLGSYIIIDISWYAPYKQFGDKIILAICWALFIWRLYIKLPGIISGAEGSIVATDKAYDRYTRTNSKKGD